MAITIGALGGAVVTGAALDVDAVNSVSGRALEFNGRRLDTVLRWVVVVVAGVVVVVVVEVVVVVVGSSSYKGNSSSTNDGSSSNPKMPVDSGYVG